MANALACACANASLALLDDMDWQPKVNQWQQEMTTKLQTLRAAAHVKDVRVLGHVGVIEMQSPQLAASVQPLAQAQGVWLRPFGAWVYLTPAYTMNSAEREQLLTTTTDAVLKAADTEANNSIMTSI